MGLSKLDVLYRKLILTKFYTRGWGKPEEMKEILKMHKLISKRETCSKMVSPDYQVNIDKSTELKNYTLMHGHFKSPVMDYLPSLVPKECQIASFQVVLPKPLPGQNVTNSLRPACIHMAGTGDHGFHRRREIYAKPLLQSGITSVLLENPFYGSRKPKEQWRSGLLHVTDLFIMGGCLILEAQVLLHWLKRMGYGPLGLTGVSMGGHMASLAATNWPEPIALVPCMSWTSASVVWTDGVLSKSISWRLLESQYAREPKYEMEIANLLRNFDSYKLGKDFVTGDGLSQVSKEPRELISHPTINKRNLKRINERRRREGTIQFMKGVMDEITHLGNYSTPVDPSAVTFVIAKEDAYFPQSSLQHMADLWPGCEVREINAGHVAGCVFHHAQCTKAIIETFARLTDRTQSQSTNCNKHLPHQRNGHADTQLMKIQSKEKQISLIKSNVSHSVFTILRSFVMKS